MQRRRKIWAAVLAGVMLQLTAGLAVAARVVVCRAPSGHVAIESVLGGDCCPPADESVGVRGLEADTCHGCSDTPLLRAGPSKPGKVTPGPLDGTPRRLTQTFVLPRAPGVAPRVESDATGPGRTVVLLI